MRSLAPRQAQPPPQLPIRTKADASKRHQPPASCSPEARSTRNRATPSTRTTGGCNIMLQGCRGTSPRRVDDPRCNIWLHATLGCRERGWVNPLGVSCKPKGAPGVYSSTKGLSGGVSSTTSTRKGAHAPARASMGRQHVALGVARRAARWHRGMGVDIRAVLHANTVAVSGS
jgi:hypothetical protein